MRATKGAPADPRLAAIRAALKDHCIVLVGMMGSGKSAIGQRLAARLGLKFVDADAEIVAAAGGMSIPEIFAKYGEGYFRDGERRVMLSPAQRRADGAGDRRRRLSRSANAAAHRRARRLDLVRRGSRNPAQAGASQVRPAAACRPPIPAATLRRLMDERYPVYALADIKVVSRDAPQEAMVERDARRCSPSACRRSASARDTPPDRNMPTS